MHMRVAQAAALQGVREGGVASGQDVWPDEVAATTAAAAVAGTKLLWKMMSLSG